MKKVKKTTVFYWIYGIVILLVIGIIAFLFAYILERSVTIKSDSIVLWFVGFLTAFIVIGNYAQVKSIEQDFSQKVGELKHEFSEKVKKLETEFDKKVFASQNFIEIKEVYKQMTELRRVAEKLVSIPYSKRNSLIEEGKKHLDIFLTLILTNKFNLPKDLFSLFKEIEELLSQWFNNCTYTSSTSDNNVSAEEEIQRRLVFALSKTKELEEKIDELYRLKFKI